MRKFSGLFWGAAFEFGCGCLWPYLVTFVLMVGADFDGFVGLVIRVLGFGWWF